MRPGVLLEGIDSRGWAEPLPRLVRIEAGAVCFDAGTIRGDIDGPLWEWRGPLVVPDKFPVG